MNAGAMATWPFACRADEVAEMESAIVGAGRGVVIAGDAGVGKSRAMAELSARLERSGLTVRRVSGTSALSTVPYGAFAPVLSSATEPGRDEFTVLQGALEELTAGGQPTVLAVDDAHLLDRNSTALVSLAARSGVPVVATVRHGEVCPEGITALWRDDLATRSTLLPLDIEQVGEMLTLALGAPVDSYTRHRLWEITTGNLLFLRELVRTGLARGALAEHGDVWIWTGGFEGATHLLELLRDTVTAQPPAVRRVVELLAVGEPLGATIVGDLSDDGALDAAEAAGLVVAVRTSRRLEVRLVHPIYAQVVREALGRVRIEGLSRELADAMSRRGQRRADDVLRVAALQLTAGAAADPVALLKAARHARQYADVELAEGLARQAFAVGGGAAAAITLAESLYWQGRHHEVLDLLAGGILDDAEPKDVRYGTIQIASALFFGQGRLADAEAWLQRGIQRVGPGYEPDLIAWRARMLMVAGRAVECIAEARRVLDRPEATPLARLDATIAMLPALGACGRLQEVADNRTIALELASTVGRGLPSAIGPLTVGLFVSHLFDGQMREFDLVLASLNDAAMERAEDPYRGVWPFLMGRSALLQGQLADSVPLLREAAALLRLRDPGMMLPWCLAALVQALGESDNARDAQSVLHELESVRFEVTKHIEVEVELARAWAAAAAGNRSDAGNIALAVARRLYVDGRSALAAMAYHDALRVGASPDLVAAPLHELTDRAEGPVVVAMAAHAQAAADGDHRAMAVAADAFEAVGMMLHAAEAMADAGRLATDAGLRGTASELRVRASALVAGCGPALTPLLEPISGRDALSVLTRKEQEVALMAARGMTKRDMAESLSVSVRTVGNHINHLYAKLGVSTRDELRAVLRLTASPRSAP